MSKERTYSQDPEKQMAVKAAMARGLTKEEIDRFSLSPCAGFGAAIKQRITNMGLDTEQFSEKTGVSPEDLRGIYFGLVDPDIVRDRFEPIAEGLNLSTKAKASLIKYFPFLKEDS